MNKEFLINIIILITINVLVKPLYLFGVETHVQNLVGMNEWGIYAQLFNFAFLFHIIHEPGIQSYNSKNIAQHPESLGTHFPNILGIKVILFCLFMAVTIIGFFTIGFKPEFLMLLIVIAINQFLAAFFLYLRTNIASVGKYRIDSFISSIDKILMLIIVGFIAYYPATSNHFQIIWLAYGQLAALLISCAVAFFIISSHLHFMKINISWVYFKRLIFSSYPFALILLFMSIYTRIDSVMIGRMLSDGDYEAGIYGACYRILDALNMVGYLFAALLLPMFAANIVDKVKVEGLLNTSLKILSVMALTGAIGIIVFRTEILYFLYDEATPHFGNILMYLILSFIAVSISYIFGTLLVANGNLKKLNILYFSGIIINVGLNLFLISSYKAEGAALATFITQVMMMIGQIYLCISITKVKIPIVLFLKILIFGLICAFVFTSVYYYIDMLWIWKLMIGIITCIIMSLLLKIMDLSEMAGLLKQRKSSN